MKKSILIITLLLSSFAFQSAKAQIKLGLSYNIGQQPIWGPTGYDHAEYYYIPDLDVFYNVPNQQYIYQDQGRWIFNRSLPGRYKDYDLYKGYKVVVNDYLPYHNAQMYRIRYSGYKGKHDQEFIRNSHEDKYFENKNHPEHNKWKGNGKGHGNGKYKNKDKEKDKDDDHDNGKKGHKEKD